MIGDKLQDILEAWQKNQVQRVRLQFEIGAIDRTINDQVTSSKALIKQGATTGDQARDIAIGVHGTLDPLVILFYRQIEGEIASCVGQLVLVVETVLNDDRRICYLNDGDEVALGLAPPNKPRPHRRLSVGRLSGKGLIFDREKMVVSFPTDGKMVSCTINWDCLIFINNGQPKLEPTNLPLKVYTEDAMASSDGKPMPSGMSVLIGDTMIKQWFKQNAPAGIRGAHDDTPSVWDKILACFNPASAASASSAL